MPTRHLAVSPPTIPAQTKVKGNIWQNKARKKMAGKIVGGKEGGESGGMDRAAVSAIFWALEWTKGLVGI